MKLIFFGKKWHPNYWFCSREKSSKSLKEIFFEKKNLPSYLYRFDLPNDVRKIFLYKWVSRHLTFGDFSVPKIVLLRKTIHKTRSIKNQENSVHRFGDNDLTNHLVKFVQDRIKPWKVGPLGMRRLKNVSFLSHLGWNVADNIETSSRRRYWYVNETPVWDVATTCHCHLNKTDQFETL